MTALWISTARRLAPRLCLLVLLLAAGCARHASGVPTPLVTAARTDDPPIEVLLLGTFHFSQVDTLQYDVLSAERQPQVTAVVEALAKWRPNKVFVEWQPEFNQRLADSLMGELRTNGPLRRRNEVYQLGMRTAARLGQSRVYTMDHPGRYGALYQPMAKYAAEHGQQAILDGTAPYTRKAEYELRRAVDDSARNAMTLSGYLRAINTPRALASDHSVYVARMVRIGEVRSDLLDSTGESRSGAELVSDWYRRNVQMYAKMLKWMDFSERRIVIIVGSSHVPILRHLFETHGGFRVVEVAGVLNDP